MLGEDWNVQIARKAYYAGYCCLPLVWALNYIAHRHLLGSADVHEDLKKYVLYSRNAFIAALALWIVWIAIFYSSLGFSWTQKLSTF